jgi:hypothetical protein
MSVTVERIRKAGRGRIRPRGKPAEAAFEALLGYCTVNSLLVRASGSPVFTGAVSLTVKR